MTTEVLELMLAGMALLITVVLLLQGTRFTRLDQESPDSNSSSPVLQVGQTGIAISFLRPSGQAQFGSRILDVLTEGEVVKKGRTVFVIQQIDGDTYVKEVV